MGFLGIEYGEEIKEIFYKKNFVISTGKQK